MATAVGVSVGKLEGRLQASMDKIRISGNNRLRGFIASPFVDVYYLMQESQRWQ
jgi:hypothetical protein